MKKKIFSYLLLSTLVLSAATAPIVAADDVAAAGDNSPAVESVTQPQTQTQKFNINYWALRGGEGGTSLGTETVEVSPGETYTVHKKDFPGYEFQGASIDNGATGTDVELPHNLKHGDNNQGIDLFYRKSPNPGKEPEKPAPNPGKEPEKPADPEKGLPKTGEKDNSFFTSFVGILGFLGAILLFRKKNS